MTTALDEILARIDASGLLDDPTLAEGTIAGHAHLEAAGTDVKFDVDPEVDDRDTGSDEVDVDLLIDGLTRILSISEKRWRAVVDEVATEIEDSVGEVEISERIDLRDDLEAKSVVVFADAVVVSLIAPRQFPDSQITVQLDDDLEVDDVAVVEGDGDEAD